MSFYRVIQVRTRAPFEGVGCSPEALSLKLGYHGRGYLSRSIGSSGLTPPSVGFPLNLLAPALDTPSEFSRQASFSTPCWAPLTLVLEGDRRTHPVGRSMLPRGSYGVVRLLYLVTEGRVVVVRFLARWARLFRREPFQRSSVGRIRNVLLERGIRPLGGAFIWGVLHLSYPPVGGCL